MKTASPALAALINTAAFVVFDLYTITLAGASGSLLLTTADVDIAYGGQTWSSKGARVDNANSQALAHWKIGLDVDTWQVAIMPRAQSPSGTAFPDKIGSVPWLAAAAQGALDAADVLIQRAYFATPPSYPIPPGGAVPVGLLTVFRGQIAEVDVNTSMALLTINDYRYLLTMQMPRNFYASGCRHRLFDAQCGLAAASFAKTGIVGANSTRGAIVAAVASPSGSGTYTLGRMVMTSGLNMGFGRTISQWDGAQTFTLISPFPFTVALGDAFTIYPGCDKQMTTCQDFGNLINFGGDPFVPPPGNRDAVTGAERSRVVEVARSWLTTPFHDVAGVKGVGVDCAHLVERVYAEAGVMETLPIDPYPPQWMLHRDEERFIAHIEQRGHEIAEAEVQPGDMAIFKVGRCFSHGAIVVSWPDELIHAWKPARSVILARRDDSDLKDRPVRFFSLW